MEEYGSVFLFRASAVMVSVALGIYACMQWKLGNLTAKVESSTGSEVDGGGGVDKGEEGQHVGAGEEEGRVREGGVLEDVVVDEEGGGDDDGAGRRETGGAGVESRDGKTSEEVNGKDQGKGVILKG